MGLGVDWFGLAQNRDTERALVNGLMTRRVPYHENV